MTTARTAAVPGGSTARPEPGRGPDPDELREAVGTLLRDGVVGCAGAFPTVWADDLREDVEAAFAEARGRPDGAVGRGPHRWYVEVHPEQVRGFVDLVEHPWVRGVAEAALGPAYEVVELGFDIPFAGAQDQPWHRDFPAPEETVRDRRLTSLAVNVTAVDTEEDMGPFEIAPGTQYDDGSDFAHGMFPDRSTWDRYAARAVRKHPRRGDVSARSALTLHRGTRNLSQRSRPVLVLGLDAPGAGNAEHHDMAVSREYWQGLPERVRAHLHCPVVDRLVPITQKHTIEGLVMGEP